MKTLTLLVACALLGSVAHAASVEATLKQAEQAWEQRDQPGKTEEAIQLWQSALKEDPRRADIYVPLTKAAGRLYRNTQNTQEKKKWANQGREWGKQAVTLNKDTPQAHAEYGAALGQWAQIHKGVRGLGVVKEAVKNLERAVKLDPYYAYAHMLLARFYQDAPSIISVGDKEKAFEHALLAVEHGDAYAINHVTLARIYLAHGKKAEARKQLEKALTLTAPPDAIPETKSDQETAKEMLKNL
jgi:tetratricopeptide (TPR) repeat protein